MPPSARLRGVHSWLGIGLLCSITLWVTVFYVVEAQKITNNSYDSSFTEYYAILGEAKN